MRVKFIAWVRRISIAGVILGLCVPLTLAAQSEKREPARKLIGISAGLGIGAHSAFSITDYINAVAQPVLDQRLEEFNSAAEFYAVPEVQISDEWAIAVEYSLLVKSYALSGSGGVGRSEFFYAVHMPTAILHYLVPGDGYWLKLGGGVGYHMSTFSQTLFGTNQEVDYRSRGLGLKVEAVGNTRFDESFYGSIGLDLRWGFGGVFKNADGTQATVGGRSAALNFFTIGLKLGVMFVL